MRRLEGVVYICIPTPNYTPFKRGLHASRNTLMTENVKLRMSKRDFNLVRKHARNCGMAVAAFIRHCAVWAAREMEEPTDAV